jgi:hypothetical protein
VTPPQLGHVNFTAFSSGLIFVPHEMHEDIRFANMPINALFKGKDSL